MMRQQCSLQQCNSAAYGSSAAVAGFMRQLWRTPAAGTAATASDGRVLNSPYQICSICSISQTVGRAAPGAAWRRRRGRPHCTGSEGNSRSSELRTVRCICTQDAAGVSAGNSSSNGGVKKSGAWGLGEPNVKSRAEAGVMPAGSCAGSGSCATCVMIKACDTVLRHYRIIFTPVWHTMGRRTVLFGTAVLGHCSTRQHSSAPVAP